MEATFVFQGFTYQKSNRIRRACQNCREKKLRCDGNSQGCFRCKHLGIQCTFIESKLRRGRPRGRLLGNDKQSLLEIRDSRALKMQQQENMYKRFQMYVEKIDQVINGLNIFQVSSPVLDRRWRWRWARGIQFAYSPAPKVMTNEMLGLILERISSLSIDESVEKKLRLIKGNEGYQPTPLPFKHRDPLKSISYDQGIMLINAWFQLNTFPTILSRTIMFNNYRDQRYDPFLYSVVFSSALNLSRTPLFNQTKSGRPGSVFIEYALSLLEHEKTEPSLTKLQGLFILGAELIYNGQPRKAIPLMAMTWKLAHELRIHEQDSDHFDLKLDPVERELRNNLWWAMRISFIWGYLQLGTRVDKDLFKKQLHLPVKNEDESVLYALDLRHGYCTPYQEHPHAIRTFYNFAYLTEFLSGIWMQITPATGFRSLLNPEKGEVADGEHYSLQKFVSILPTTLHTLMSSIPSNLSPVNAAEILLYFNILLIHSRFPRSGNDILLTVENDRLSECIASADTIVDLAKIILDDSYSLPLHSLIVFALSTSACVHLLVAGAGTDSQRREALFRLKMTFSLLNSQHIGYHDNKLISLIEGVIARASDDQGLGAGSPGYMNAHGNPHATITVVIPRVTLDSLVNLETKDEVMHENKSIVVLLQPTQDQEPSSVPHSMEFSQSNSSQVQPSDESIFGWPSPPAHEPSHISFAPFSDLPRQNLLQPESIRTLSEPIESINLSQPANYVIDLPSPPACLGEEEAKICKSDSYRELSGLLTELGDNANLEFLQNDSISTPAVCTTLQNQEQDLSQLLMGHQGTPTYNGRQGFSI
ncbi:uncharacterized protein VTP21DRAFT_8055 [Calcarisporiella thermophila]|uniref:uncharacterized protein n=1 Tax=Calcarisporiella thermophila TaxID=911321 RepID=UPI0037443AD3